MSQLIKDVRKNEYKFTGMEGDYDAVHKQSNSLRYIEHLAQVTGTDVTEWPIGIFLNTNGRVFLDRQDLNEKFFEFKVKADALPKTAKPINIAAVKVIEKTLADVLERRISDELNQMVRAEEAMRTHVDRLQEQQRKVFYHGTVARSLEKAQKSGFNLAKQVQMVIDGGFWELAEDTNALQFISRPLSLSYFHKEQRRDNAIHLGRVLLTIGINNDGLWPTVTKYSGAVHKMRNPHPHVGTDGSICFGEIQNAAHKAMGRLDIAALCAYVESVMDTYNEDDAFVHIYEFEGEEGPPDEEDFDPPDEPDYDDEEPADEEEAEPTIDF